MIRSDGDIADFLVAVGADDQSRAQLVLQQAAEHDFLPACRALVDQLNADPDTASRADSRSPREIGKASSDSSVRDYFAQVGAYCNRYVLRTGQPLRHAAEFDLIAARDLEANKMVVLKSMQEPSDCALELEARGWKQNAGVWSPPSSARALSSSYVLPVLDICLCAPSEDMGSNVLVFPHYDRTLDQAAGLELFPGLRTAAACRVLRRIAEAVFHIHDRGVIHCNLGPRNGTWAEAWLIYPFLLLVTRAASLLLSNNAVVRVDDTWKLMDFGASARNDARRSVERIGTAYCAPEIARAVFGGGALPAAERAHDAWSFGVLAYEQCAGEFLFSRDLVDDDIKDDSERNRLCMWRWIPDEQLFKVFARDEADASEAQRAAARDLITRCLDGDPANRPNFGEILEHPFLQDGGGGSFELPIHRRYHFFLSHYQAQAADNVAALYFQLRLRGALVWLDQYQDVITEAGMRAGVEAADAFVFFLTSDALTREFCLKEFGWALELRKPILLVREDDERFMPWRRDKWRDGQSWNAASKSWRADPSAQYEALATGLRKDGAVVVGADITRRIRDEVDAQADAGRIVTYRRRDFEVDAMMSELLRLAAQDPNVLWRPRARAVTAQFSSSSPLRMMVVYYEPTGQELVDRLHDAFGARVRRVPSPAEADVALAVLSEGFLAGDNRSRRALEEVLRLRGDPPVLFVHSQDAGWEFYSEEHLSAPQLVQTAIAEAESMTMRGPAHEHAAMVDELLRRCERIVRTSPVKPPRHQRRKSAADHPQRRKSAANHDSGASYETPAQRRWSESRLK